MAFTDFGIENLTELIRMHKEDPQAVESVIHCPRLSSDGYLQRQVSQALLEATRRPLHLTSSDRVWLEQEQIVAELAARFRKTIPRDREVMALVVSSRLNNNQMRRSSVGGDHDRDDRMS